MEKGTSHQELVQLEDIFPTVLDLAGLSQPRPKVLGQYVVLANLEVADKLGGCLPSFDSHGRHFSVVLTTAFVVVRSSQNCITLQGSHYSQATVGLNVAVNITQGVRDDGLSRKPTSADSIIVTSAAPHKGIFGAIPSVLAGALARPD